MTLQKKGNKIFLLIPLVIIILIMAGYLIINSLNTSYSLVIPNDEIKKCELKIEVKKFVYIKFDKNMTQNIKVTIEDEEGKNLGEYNPKTSEKDSRIIYKVNGNFIVIKAEGSKEGEEVKFNIMGI